MPGHIKPKQLHKLLGVGDERQEAVINGERLWIYQYHADQRLPHSEPKVPAESRRGLTGDEPPPPPLELPPNMKFYGYGTVPSGSSRRAFLTDGDEVYIVAEGDVFLGRYRITKIGNVTIEFEEVSSGRQGKTNLEDAGPTT